MSRFIILMAVLTSIIYAWTWSMTKREKKSAKRVAYRLAISAGIAGIIVACLYFINNISGV